jgi:hypothetical protein
VLERLDWSVVAVVHVLWNRQRKNCSVRVARLPLQSLQQDSCHNMISLGMPQKRQGVAAALQLRSPGANSAASLCDYGFGCPLMRAVRWMLLSPPVSDGLSTRLAAPRPRDLARRRLADAGRSRDRSRLAVLRVQHMMGRGGDFGRGRRLHGRSAIRCSRPPRRCRSPASWSRAAVMKPMSSSGVTRATNLGSAAWSWPRSRHRWSHEARGISAVRIHQLISVAINWRGLQASVKYG